MSEDIGEYSVQIRVKGPRSNAHFLVKDIENSCDLAEKYLDLEVEIKVVMRK